MSKTQLSLAGELEATAKKLRTGIKKGTISSEFQSTVDILERAATELKIQTQIAKSLAVAIKINMSPAQQAFLPGVRQAIEIYDDNQLRIQK